MAGQISQVERWSLIFDGVDFGGPNGGLANQNVITMAAPEAAASQTTMGAGRDAIITEDAQSLVRKVTVRVIVGLKAYIELHKRMSQQLENTGTQKPIPHYSGSVMQTTLANGVSITVSYPFDGATFVTYHEKIPHNANAGPEQSIEEFEFTGIFGSIPLS